MRASLEKFALPCFVKISKIEKLLFLSEQSNTIKGSSKLIICCLKHLSISLENYLTVFNLWSRVRRELGVRLSAALGRGVRIFHQWGASLGLRSQSEARRGSGLPGLERVQCPAKLKRIVRAVGSLLECREGRGSPDIETWETRKTSRQCEPFQGARKNHFNVDAFTFYTKKRATIISKLWMMAVRFILALKYFH